MIHAQHGTRRAPHIFFDVMHDERYSETLDKHFIHKVLRIGYNYNGPTEIGGLVLHPDYRRKPERARQVALVRALPLHRAAPRVVPRRGALGAAAAARGRRHVAPVGGARPPLHRHDVSGGRSHLADEQGVHPRALSRRARSTSSLLAATRCRSSSARSGPRPRASRRCCGASASSTPSASIRSTAARTSSPRPTTSRSSKRPRTARVVALPAGADDGRPLRARLGRARSRAALRRHRLALPARRHRRRPARRDHEALGLAPGDERRRAALLMSHDTSPTSSPPPSCATSTASRARSRDLWRERPALMLWVRHFG